MGVVSQFSRQVGARVLSDLGLLCLHRRIALRNRALVLMYHRVLPDDILAEGIEPGMFVTRRTFNLHLAALCRDFSVVTIDDIGEWLAGRKRFERPPCAITFDDGWLDNYRVAFPLLKRYGATATVFLVTGAVGESDTLAWDHIGEMEESGILFGSHTVSHPRLGECQEDRIRNELTESRATLERRLRHPSRWFCFPQGSHSDLACSIAAELYLGAVTTRRGWVSRGDDPFRVRRIGIHNDISSTASLFGWRISLLP